MSEVTHGVRGPRLTGTRRPATMPAPMFGSVPEALQALDMRLGHAQTANGASGCTVLLCPPQTVASCDVQGPAPGSRETALLAPEKPIQHVHAILLTGGSAFGLAAADGVVRYLAERGIGHPTPVKPVPLVPAAVLYDLFLSPQQHPDADTGYQACVNATTHPAEGNVGAGSGATAGKWNGPAHAMKSGLGVAAVKVDEAWVLVVAAANPVGDIVGADMSVIAGARSQDGGWQALRDPLRRLPLPPLPLTGNTTLVAVGTTARLSKPEVHRLAARCHDGIALAVHPAHTSFDGDTTFALATGSVDTPIDHVGNAAVLAVAQAIRQAALTAVDLAALPGAAGSA